MRLSVNNDSLPLVTNQDSSKKVLNQASLENMGKRAFSEAYNIATQIPTLTLYPDVFRFLCTRYNSCVFALHDVIKGLDRRIEQ